MNRSLRQQSVLPEMRTDIGQRTRQEVLAKRRRPYARAGMDYRRHLLDRVIERFGSPRQAAFHVLRHPRLAAKVRAPDRLFLGQRPQTVPFARARPDPDDDSAPVAQPPRDARTL